MTITTNNHSRDLLAWYDLPTEARADFDYLREDMGELADDWSDDAYAPRFFRYRGAWYDVQDFVLIESDINPSGMRAPFAHVVERGSELAQWDGIATDSYFSATVVRYARDEWGDGLDPESVIVGTWSAE